MYFPQEEYEARWAKVHAEMRRRGLDAAVVWSRSGGTYDRCGNVLYLTNYVSTSNGQIADEPIWAGRAFAAVILQLGEVPWLHMDEPFPRLGELATQRVDDHRDVIAGVAKAVGNLGLERVGFVGSEILPVKYARRLEAMTPGIEWVDEDDLVDSQLRIKSTRELDCYREGGLIASRALTRLIGALVSGEPEATAAAGAAEEIIRSGGTFHMIPVNHGQTLRWWTRSTLPTWSLDAARPGELVRGFVIGPVWQGYWLDPGRTAVCGGRGSAEARELVEATAAIVERCIAAIAPGVPVVEIAKLGEALTEDFGTVKDQIAELVPLFGHGIGHFWEHPFFGQAFLTGDEVFEAGMVCGIEAFLGREGVGSTAFEQNVIVTDSGTELLTTTPMVWH